MGWVFQGNPKRFDLDDYLSRYPALVYWLTPRYASDIAVGDRAFIWRAGEDSGAVAIGTIAELPIEANRARYPEALGDDLWVAEQPSASAIRTGIRIEELRLTTPEGMVSREVVKADPDLESSSLIRMANATVFRLTESQTQAMERLWGVGVLSSEATKIEEGERRLRAHYVRERSSRLRVDKLNDFRKMHGRLFCEICREVESERYPADYGARVFEVHHRAPLSTALAPVRTTLSDLAVLCANCHRSVHTTKDVETNYQLLVEHFAERTAGTTS